MNRKTAIIGVLVLLMLLTSVNAQKGQECRYLETVTVSATDSDGQDSVNSLANGGNYELRASGTYVFTSLSGAFADAEYLTLDNWATTNRVAAGFTLPEEVSDLLVDKAAINWGAYSPSHTYTYAYVGTGAPVNLQIDDWYLNSGDPWNCHTNYQKCFDNPMPSECCMSDNSGSLTVDIYSCDSNGEPLPEFGSLLVPLAILIIAPAAALALVKMKKK